MNAFAQQITAALAAGFVLHASEREEGLQTGWPLTGAGLAAIFTSLPDFLEPATNPIHRQFFHSLVFAGGVACCWRAVLDWQPDTDDGRLLRKVALIAAGAYICHLALDATTAKSLPFLGR